MQALVRTCFCLMLLALLGACSTTRTVDADVRAYSRLQGPQALAARTYRFERLPSQLVALNAAPQTGLEVQAEQALAVYGMQRTDDQPRYSVQVQASLNSYLQ